MVSPSIFLRISLGAAIADWAEAGCHWGDKCYVVPVTGPDAPGQPTTEMACTPDCSCFRYHTRFWRTTCDAQCVARVAGNPSSCHDGILTCNDPVLDVPTVDKMACVPKAWKVTQVSSTWTRNVLATTWPVGLFGDGAQASSTAWGEAVTHFLKTNPVNFKMNQAVVAKRVGLLDHFARQWEHPQWPPVEVPVQNETYRTFWAHEMRVADNLLSGSLIRLGDLVFADAPPCCFPGFCANAACDTCTGADMLIPGSDIERCKVASEVQPSIVL